MRRALILTVAFLVVATGCWFAWTHYRDSEPVVFDSIAVGDSEELLVDALTRSGIDFHKGQGEGITVYSHSDGFVGIYIYHVQDGRVIKKVAD